MPRILNIVLVLFLLALLLGVLGYTDPRLVPHAISFLEDNMIFVAIGLAVAIGAIFIASGPRAS